MFENLGVQADDGTVASLTKSSLTSILISNPLITERKYAEAKTRVSVISPIKDLTGRIRAFQKSPMTSLGVHGRRNRYAQARNDCDWHNGLVGLEPERGVQRDCVHVQQVVARSIVDWNRQI